MFVEVVQQGGTDIPPFISSVYFYALLIGAIAVVASIGYNIIKKFTRVESAVSNLGQGLKEQGKGIQKVADATLAVANEVKTHLIQDSADKAEFRSDIKYLKGDIDDLGQNRSRYGTYRDTARDKKKGKGNND